MYHTTEVNGISIALKNIHSISKITSSKDGKQRYFEVQWKEIFKDVDLDDFMIVYPEKKFHFQTELEAGKCKSDLEKEWDKYLGRH